MATSRVGRKFRIRRQAAMSGRSYGWEAPEQTGEWIGPTQVRRGPDRLRQDSCPVSLDLVRPHLADLRRTTSPETPFSGLSHPIWSARAILSAVSHSIWSATALLSVVPHPALRSSRSDHELAGPGGH
jgi:hypothetical protein